MSYQSERLCGGGGGVDDGSSFSTSERDGIEVSICGIRLTLGRQTMKLILFSCGRMRCGTPWDSSYVAPTHSILSLDI